LINKYNIYGIDLFLFLACIIFKFKLLLQQKRDYSLKKIFSFVHTIIIVCCHMSTRSSWKIMEKLLLFLGDYWAGKTKKKVVKLKKNKLILNSRWRRKRLSHLKFFKLKVLHKIWICCILLLWKKCFFAKNSKWRINQNGLFFIFLDALVCFLQYFCLIFYCRKIRWKLFSMNIKSY
jgi:hypothetical protein